MSTKIVNLEDVRRAERNIASHLSLPTPLIYSPGLSERLKARVSLKLETAMPISVFKARGGINFLADLPLPQRKAGVVTASTGNHGQSLAYAANVFGVRSRIYMPVGANPDKIASIERLGGEVVLTGQRFDDARLEALQQSAEHQMHFVHPVNEPALINGVGTAALEVLERQGSETDLVIVPVGAGSAACGWVTVRDGLNHPAEIWATQSAQAPAAHDSWRSGEVVERPDTTFAEGLATGVAFALPMRILQGRLNDFILVDDKEIASAVCTLIDLAHVLAEPAGAASTAAAVKEADRIRGKNVVLVVSGANVTREQLRALL